MSFFFLSVHHSHMTYQTNIKTKLQHFSSFLIHSLALATYCDVWTLECCWFCCYLLSILTRPVCEKGNVQFRHISLLHCVGPVRQLVVVLCCMCVCQTDVFWSEKFHLIWQVFPTKFLQNQMWSDGCRLPFSAALKSSRDQLFSTFFVRVCVCVCR